MTSEPVSPAPAFPPPGRQSLSPFESHTTTMVVWWSLLLVSTAILVVCWTLWI